MSNSTSTKAADQTDLTEAQAAFTEAYRSGDRKAKAEVRRQVKALQTEAAEAGDPITWLAWVDFEKGLAPEKATKAEVDYQALVAAHIEGLRQLAQAYEEGTVTPEGVPDGFTYEVDPDRTPADEAVADEAARIHKAVKVLSGTKAPKGNISAHIEQVFESVPSGTFLTEAQIQGTSTDAYPGGTPKGGNVHASLFGSTKKTQAWIEAGIKPQPGNGTQPAGASKI